MTNKLASSAGNLLDDKAAMDSFSLALAASGRRSGTSETYLKSLKNLADFGQAKGMPPVLYLSTEHLREYFKGMWDRDLQASTISITYRALQQFYKWAVEDGERKDNPLERIHPPKVEEKIQAHYSPTEIEAVLKRMPAVSRDWRILRNRALILVLYDTGLRGAELCGVKRDHLSLRELTVQVQKAKGDRWREVAISATTAQAIDRYLRHRKDLSPWLFIQQDGGPLTTNGLRMMLERTWAAAGLDFRGVHAFRRGFAIQFLENGGDPEDLRTLAGWESSQMLRRYTKATETQRAKRAHARFSPVQSLKIR